MRPFSFLILCVYASQGAIGIVLRDFATARNSISDAFTEKLPTQAPQTATWMINSIELSNQNSVKLSPEIREDLQDSTSEIIQTRLSEALNVPSFETNIFEDLALTQISNESKDSNAADGDINVQSSFISSFNSSNFELDENMPIDSEAARSTEFANLFISKAIVPTSGFEFLIESETLRKAEVIEELANSLLQDISEDDFKNSVNSFFITMPNEKLQNSEVIDSETKNLEFVAFKDSENLTEIDPVAVGVRHDSHQHIMLVPRGSIQTLEDIITEANVENVTLAFHNQTIIVGISNEDLETASNQGNTESFEITSMKSEVESASHQHLNNSQVQVDMFAPDSSGQSSEAKSEITKPVTPANENLQNSTSEAKVCPPPGFCLFSFMFRDTCSKSSECRGNRLCCKSGCSKKCLDL